MTTGIQATGNQSRKRRADDTVLFAKPQPMTALTPASSTQKTGDTSVTNVAIA